jgi:hypothetical protein
MGEKTKNKMGGRCPLLMGYRSWEYEVEGADLLVQKNGGAFFREARA